MEQRKLANVDYLPRDDEDDALGDSGVAYKLPIALSAFDKTLPSEKDTRLIRDARAWKERLCYPIRI